MNKIYIRIWNNKFVSIANLWMNEPESRSLFNCKIVTKTLKFIINIQWKLTTTDNFKYYLMKLHLIEFMSLNHCHMEWILFGQRLESFDHVVNIDWIGAFRAFVFGFSHWPIFKPKDIRSLWIIIARIFHAKWKIGL